MSQKKYFDSLIADLNSSLKNNQELSKWRLNQLIDYANKDIELRRILISEGIYDINWIIWDYCNSDTLLKQKSIEWLQKQLPTYDVQSNDLNRNSIEFGKRNHRLQLILQKYYFVGEWVENNFRSGKIEKIVGIYEQVDISRYNWGNRDNAKILAKLIIRKDENEKLSSFVNSAISHYKFPKDNDELIDSYNLIYSTQQSNTFLNICMTIFS